MRESQDRAVLGCQREAQSVNGHKEGQKLEGLTCLCPC